jgi:hypothetical protein
MEYNVHVNLDKDYKDINICILSDSQAAVKAFDNYLTHNWFWIATNLS